MAERIEMPFEVWTQVGTHESTLDGGAHRRNLANMTETSMCGSDEAFLSNHSDQLLNFHIAETRLYIFLQRV